MSDTKRLRRQDQIRIFLSHSEVDTVLARKLRNLISSRLNARVFIAEELIMGAKWEAKLRNELELADVVVALLTPYYLTSNWVLHELGAAWALEKPIIPLVTRRDVLNRMPVSVEQSRALDLTPEDIDDPQKAEEFVQKLQETWAPAPTR